MTPLEAKLELLRQSVRLGYVGKESLGLQRLFNTIDAFIAGARTQWDTENTCIWPISANCSSAVSATTSIAYLESRNDHLAAL